jgi:hypothetical protein
MDLHTGCHQLNLVFTHDNNVEKSANPTVVTPGGSQISYKDLHIGCHHQLKRVLTHTNNVEESAQPYLAVDVLVAAGALPAVRLCTLNEVDPKPITYNLSNP